ncbi:hypothetical protein F4604DRAFT_1689652 [Suillus subluteus]|nr:hypothetical protein F4604DRAFT_1689652 [Suillus subluteus]
MCAINNTQPCLSEYLKQVVKMLMSWQMGALDNPRLFHEFAMHQFDTSGDLMVCYTAVETRVSAAFPRTRLARFLALKRPASPIIQERPSMSIHLIALTAPIPSASDVISIPSQVEIASPHPYATDVDEQPATHILLPEICRHAMGPDPLLNNLWVIRDDLKDLGAKLKDWLAEKIKDGSTALEEMT